MAPELKPNLIQSVQDQQNLQHILTLHGCVCVWQLPAHAHTMPTNIGANYKNEYQKSEFNANYTQWSIKTS